MFCFPLAPTLPYAVEDPLRGLIARVQNGDPAAFPLLYRQTRHEVHRVIFQLVGHSADLEDLIQDSYLQLLSALKHFRGDSRFSTFLHRVCANVALMYLRKRTRRREEIMADLPERPSGVDPEHAVYLQQANRLMEAALDGLDPNKRVVFVYHDVLGMKPEEIAEALKTNANTVRSRLNRARVQFEDEVDRLQRKPWSGVSQKGSEGEQR